MLRGGMPVRRMLRGGIITSAVPTRPPTVLGTGPCLCYSDDRAERQAIAMHSVAKHKPGPEAEERGSQTESLVINSWEHKAAVNPSGTCCWLKRLPDQSKVPVMDAVPYTVGGPRLTR